ncbi:SDR family oxidoreductase [Streptomyces sp. DSM 41972]|uniref:SDR family oxidoreductase n=1 Tax=Streptomyces althioticus subsp. attaecolombicae TaxID=3075534 RepID=A0ABU3I1Q0_9ACTN|nr:SDR family oxidoreductase [Streptomyces sp. DSM 41972]
MTRLEGEAALFSGTARGQGRATALRFAADAHPVNGVSRPTPLGRPGHPDDVVDAAVLLAPEEAACITGAHLDVDGGWSTVLPETPIRKAVRT